MSFYLLLFLLQKSIYWNHIMWTSKFIPSSTSSFSSKHSSFASSKYSPFHPSTLSPFAFEVFSALLPPPFFFQYCQSLVLYLVYSSRSLLYILFLFIFHLWHSLFQMALSLLFSCIVKRSETVNIKTHIHTHTHWQIIVSFRDAE